MQRSARLVAALSILLAVPTIGAAEINVVLDAKPFGLLISPDADGFAVERSSGGGFLYESEEIEGTGSWLPAIQAGIGYENRVVRLDLTGGVGFLWNAAFDTHFVAVQFAPRFKLGRAITLGPRVAAVSFSDLNWNGDADVDFEAESGVNGYLLGLDFYAGGRKVGFTLNVDYADLEPFKVRTSEGWVANTDELDLSGVAIQMGVLCHF